MTASGIAITIGLMLLLYIGMMLGDISKKLFEMNRHLIWLRRELRAGLGVQSDDQRGYAASVFLADAHEFIRQRQKR